MTTKNTVTTKATSKATAAKATKATAAKPATAKATAKPAKKKKVIQARALTIGTTVYATAGETKQKVKVTGIKVGEETFDSVKEMLTKTAHKSMYDTADKSIKLVVTGVRTKKSDPQVMPEFELTNIGGRFRFAEDGEAISFRQ